MEAKNVSLNDKQELMNATCDLSDEALYSLLLI